MPVLRPARINRVWFALALSMAGCGGAASGQAAPPTGPVTSPPTSAPSSIVVQPMSSVDSSSGAGYFSDPFPALPFGTPQGATISQSFTGTTNNSLTCPGAIAPDCFAATPVQLDPGSLRSQLVANSTTIKTYVAKAVYLDPTGTWNMVASAAVNYTGNPSTPFWYVLIHLHPTNASTPAALPSQWSGDTVLVGSLSQSAPANYGGHYFADGGQLYLVYVGRVSSSLDNNGILAQAMLSPTQPASSPPVTLIAPSTVNGGYNSEYFGLNDAPGSFKLNETGNVTKINGKYLVAYSTGAYDLPNYKIGIAWSDTFLPAAGQTYTKVLKVDRAGLWGVPSHDEVEYLLQSYVSGWPHYIQSQVLAPGVPSIEQCNDGSWKLFFAGYDPGDAPTLSGTSNYDATHRRPYYIPVKVNIPAGASVASTSPHAIESWLTPGTEP